VRFAPDTVRQMVTPQHLAAVTDFVALLYHEARNVRHLIGQGVIDEALWRSVRSLPGNRDEAWRQMSSLRTRARRATSVDGVLSLFERQFHVSVADLVEMFGNSAWRHARLHGGNAWERIGRHVIELVTALQTGDAHAAEHLISTIRTARHNTGGVSEKLADLEAAARRAGATSRPR
jgi:hypothetical protein